MDLFWFKRSSFAMKKSESLQTEGRHFRSTICKLNDVKLCFFK